MAQVVVYNVDEINTVLKIMDTELSIQGIQNIKSIANIQDILVNHGSVQEIPDGEEGPANPEANEIPSSVEELFNADEEVDSEPVDVIDDEVAEEN